MASKDLLPYQKYREKFRHCGRSGLKDAAWEAEEDPNLELSEDRAVLMKYETPGRKVAIIAVVLVIVLLKIQLNMDVLSQGELKVELKKYGLMA